jgi:hypothetical protein
MASLIAIAVARNVSKIRPLIGTMACLITINYACENVCQQFFLTDRAALHNRLACNYLPTFFKYVHSQLGGLQRPTDQSRHLIIT